MSASITAPSYCAVCYNIPAYDASSVRSLAASRRQKPEALPGLGSPSSRRLADILSTPF